ncbi:Fanconi anemia group M protein isoform X2 [Coturnix japonica]|uniref:Fanconi anemia group M protein isoform X2 n=1 Tax=Coturnix japonica TaxID=93934 RepID=UPI00077768D5|nr:Fanconi anemia group M protein isoform X2 [Coturnix japonica]
MSGSRQRSLPELWLRDAARAVQAGPGAANNSDHDDDELLAAAAAELDPEPNPNPNPDPGPEAAAAGFCPLAGALWIYPTNRPERPYQLRMARTALLANTLLCLPTGLGKTFVAAVVMYNFYRWFPSGKVLFLAPTKALVAQQMEACAELMGIPGRDMAEMTGGTQAQSRRELWAARRVLFLTPQVMVNDLSRGTCPAMHIKCLVVDEAHKALGNHAYCQVVKELSRHTRQFRVLALSATPGSDTKAVQQVVSNLLIAQIELCTEDSPEIQPYSHERQVEKIVVPLGEELGGIQRDYIHVLEAFAGRLIKMGVLSRRDIPSLTKYQVILARDQYRKNPSPQNMGMQQGIIEGDFALCISLYHGYELLQQMGTRSLFIYLCGIMDGSKGLTRTKNELGRNEDFMRLYQQLADMFSDVCQTSANGNPHKSKSVSESKKEFIYSHPKLKKLEEIVIEHFESRRKGGSEDQTRSGSPSVSTRVMIFSSFRDSVQEIAEMLSRFSPVVRVMTFVGHSTGKSTKGFTQKEQLEVVKRFREGGYNTLVSTCVGEEGLDIGEVDLIVCFDAQKSPIRLVQRMGRTGRQRQGRVVVILAEGREERTYNQSQSNKRSIQKAISGNKMLHFYQHSPRMIPEGINPELHRMFITAEKYEPTDSRKLSRGRPSSLHHKSALFSSVTDPKEMHCHGNWSLSPGEFEIWDRLYRLKESDGVKEPILPRTRFETLENLDETSKPEEEAAHKLSLSEWSIWQNRPFPTSIVEHSERCYHFISVMEMIEVMRQEQGDCSYDLELQPHLRIEDVHGLRNKSHPSTTSSMLAQKTRLSKRDMARTKRTFVPDIGDHEREFFSIFKTTNTKTPRTTTGLDLEEPELPTDTEASEPFSTGRFTPVESADLGSQKEEEIEKVMFDLNEFNDLCDDGGSPVTHESAAVEDLGLLDKCCSSVEPNHRDLGYGSFTAEKSPVSSDLFYLPESHVDSFVPMSSSEELSRLEAAFSRVKRLLARSPPPVSELEDSEKLLRHEETLCPLPQLSCRSYSGQLPDKDFPSSLEVSHSLLPAESPELEVAADPGASDNPCLSKPASSSPAAAGGAKERPPWGGSFHSLLGKEGFGANNTNNPSNKHFVQGDLEPNKKDVTVDEEKSIHLFEDEHVYEANDEMTSVNVEPLLRSGSGRHTAGPDPKLLPSGPGCPHGDTACREGAARGETAPRGAWGHGSVTEQALHTSDLCDYSQELFSVNFDLGFSIEECEEEITEGMDAMNAPELNSASGSRAGVQLTANRKSLNDGCRIQTSPKWDCRDLEGRNVSTPRLQQSRNVRDTAVPGGTPGGRTGRRPQGASPPSPPTPTGRKVNSAEATKRICKNVFSAVTEEVPEVRPMDKENANSQRKSFRSSALDALDPTGRRTENLEGTNLHTSCVFPAEGTSSESEEEIVFQRKNKRNNVLKSPDVVNDSDCESPVRAVRKRRHPRAVSDVSSDDSVDFQKIPDRSCRGCSAVGTTAQHRGVKRPKVRSSVTRKDAARQFLDEEAELSQQDESCVSSDETEDTDKELSSSITQFLNDDTEVTQVLNDSEMRGVYLKSVRSPALGSRYKMVHREFDSTEIFSQIPEQDETYVEDSFCVVEGEEETCRKSEWSEEEEEVCVNFELLNDESFGGAGRRYLTRRRKKLHGAKMEQNRSAPVQKKPSRIIVLSDSSGEETSVSNEKGTATHCSRAEQDNPELLTSLPSVSSVPHKRMAGDSRGHQSADSKSGTLLGLKAAVSDMLDFHPGPQSSAGKAALHAPAEPLQLQRSVKDTSTKAPPAPLGSDTALCVLVDSREISSGADVISSLKAVHGVKVQVCSLGSSDYVVSNRMAVERRFLSELLSSANRNKVTQRLQHLHSMFERVCVIVEKDRTKPGETSRFLQRTQHYDATLAALLQAGIRLLFSSCQEETALLLKELALVEQRKKAAICVPTEVQGHKQDMLNFYLSIPNISYLAALNMCHHFGSVRTMVNSSPSDIAAGAQVSLQRAEETYRYLRYGFDVHMLPENLCAKGKSSSTTRS